MYESSLYSGVWAKDLRSLTRSLSVPNNMMYLLKDNVYHHVMPTLTRYQKSSPSTKKNEYQSISFAAIDLKILVMIDNYSSYDIYITFLYTTYQILFNKYANFGIIS